LGRWASLLGAASLVVDYVLTVAVSLAVGVASLGSAFPSLSHHLLLVPLAALALLATVNMFGIPESAKLLVVPATLFVISILAVLVIAESVRERVQAPRSLAWRRLPTACLRSGSRGCGQLGASTGAWDAS
jgi:K+ transporter